jgi:hypothetical protein
VVRRPARRRVWLGAGAAVVLLAGAAILRRESAPGAERAVPPPEAAVSPIPVVEETLAPPSVRPPRAEPARTPAPPVLRASFRGDLLTLAHSGPQPLLDLRIVLVDASGARHDAAAADGIAPGEELHLALDDFTPPVDAAALPARLEVSARDARGGRYAFPLDLR